MIATLLFIYGLILGSFLNALVWRLRKKRDWVKERSECTHCHHVLGPKDLVPFFSWLYLRGKCRYCHKRIEDSPITELGLALAFSLSYVFWPFAIFNIPSSIFFALWLAILCIFAILCIYDFKWFLLPDKFSYAVLPLAIGFVLLRPTQDLESSIVASALGGVTCFGIFYLLFQLSSGKWIGGGDVKLAFALGLLAGSPVAALTLIFVSSLLGTLYAIPLIVRQKKLHNVQVPYGPFLMAATVLVVLFYEQFYTFFLSPLFTPF